MRFGQVARRTDIRGARRAQKYSRMQFVDALDQIDLFESSAPGVPRRGRQKCRPKLRAHFSGAEPRNVRVPVGPGVPAMQCIRGDVTLRLRMAANDPWQVIVCIDQRDAIKQRMRAREGRDGAAEAFDIMRRSRRFPSDLRGAT
jgi:hypothetical protein